ncbi:hypothetical protein ACIPLC_31110 [Kitasatospora sp. NPDC086801]|uniref:hypothetical protein n=1 Tax=Kitasatospora sp. NPDC086801 TaxID=3364066 RepID=UPI003822DAFB
MAERFDMIWRYLRLHRLEVVCLGLLATCTTSAVVGSLVAVLPSGGPSGTVSIPLRSYLPLTSAVIAVSSRHSAMADMEAAGSHWLKRSELLHTAAVAALVVVLTGVTELFVSTPEVAVVLSRAAVIWVGLAVLSGRLFGWLLSWILPVITLFPLTYLAEDENGGDRWWDWTQQEATSWPCWALAGVSMLIAACAMAATSWRTAALAGRVRGFRQGG